LASRIALIIAVLATFCIAVAIFTVFPTRSATVGKTYNPWFDYNQDGKIDLPDLVYFAGIYGTSGTPMPMSSNMIESAMLVPLPHGSYLSHTFANGGYEGDTSCILYSLDVDKDTLGDQQSVFAYIGTNITVSGVFQRFQANGGSGAILQAFFIYSWTPSWPPPDGYYYPLYNGGPGPYPGTGKQSFSFNLTVPTIAGTYYLHFCSEASFGMRDAVNQYPNPLYAPFAIINVGA
jgi:hypothetical protein